MASDYMANILGINGSAQLLATKSGAKPSADSGVFDSALFSAMAGQAPAEIVAKIGTSLSSTLASISSSYDIGERRDLALLYRSTVLDALNNAGYDAKAAADADKITVDGKSYDILRSLNSPGAAVAAQFLAVSGSGTTTASGSGGSATDVVYATAAANGELLQKFNEATSVDERLGYAEQLRDKIIDALNDSGHSAYSYGKIDKIVIDGDLYDIFRDLDAVGYPTAIQMLNYGPASDHGITGPSAATSGKSSGTGQGSEYSAAIFSAGADVASIMKQISASSDPEERTTLAQQFQQSVVQSLSDMGYTAAALSEADKISVNGVTYDIIRSLNAPGEPAYFQALRFA